ncbi:MAG: hypothetical protein JAY74_17490 [Candidatus Thiodiazotropha taylori]|nr:hypothetical protein [Candidatus Thiodiazotropha taylori]
MSKILFGNLVFVLLGIGLSILVMANTTRDVIHFLIISSPYFALLLSYPLGCILKLSRKFITANLSITLVLGLFAIFLDNQTGLFIHVSSVPIIFVSILQSLLSIRHVFVNFKKHRPENKLSKDRLEAYRVLGKRYFLFLLFTTAFLHGLFLLLFLTSSSAEDVKAASHWSIGTFLLIASSFLLLKKANYTLYVLTMLIVLHIVLAYLSFLNGVNITGVVVFYGLANYILFVLLLFYYSRVYSVRVNA